MDLKEFSVSQQQALFDLLILAMYADGHLTTAENEQLGKVLVSMGYAEKSDRQREFDAAVTRVRPFVDSIPKARVQALQLAEAFTTPDQQKQVYVAVQQLMTSDNQVSPLESTLLAELGSKFGI